MNYGPPDKRDGVLAGAIIRTGANREGIAISKKAINSLLATGHLQTLMLKRPWRSKPEETASGERNFIMSDVEKAYEEAADVLGKARDAYNKVLADFRGTIKNDLASIASSSSKVQSETSKMHDAYRNAIALLNSPEMQAAITNAERLATALTAISELKTHNITFAVLDKKPASGGSA